MKTRGEIDASICQGMSRFELEHMGRGRSSVLKCEAWDFSVFCRSQSFC